MQLRPPIRLDSFRTTDVASFCRTAAAVAQYPADAPAAKLNPDAVQVSSGLQNCHGVARGADSVDRMGFGIDDHFSLVPVSRSHSNTLG